MFGMLAQPITWKLVLINDHCNWNQENYIENNLGSTFANCLFFILH